MGTPTHDRFGHDWTLSEARTFVQHCYDRDALLETLLNFGSTWLKGRLICLVTHHQIQPFMARGWASWGDDASTTEELAQNKLQIDPQSVIATVVQEGTYTFGSPEVLGIERIFEDTSVLSPEHVMVLPIQIGSSTKMIFFGEPAFEVTDLIAFSEQAEPLVILADDIADQLEEIIRLSKARKLPRSDERIPRRAEPSSSSQPSPSVDAPEPTPSPSPAQAQALSPALTAQPASAPPASASPAGASSGGERAVAQSAALDQVRPPAGSPDEDHTQELTRESLHSMLPDELLSSTAHAELDSAMVEVANLLTMDSEESFMEEIQAPATVILPPQEHEQRGSTTPGAAIFNRKTRQLQRPEDLRLPPEQRPTHTGVTSTEDRAEDARRPRPISYDPEDKTGLRDEPTGVDIVKPIGLTDGYNAKQTLLGGFSIADIQRELSAQSAPQTRVTLQGVSAPKRISADRLEVQAPRYTLDDLNSVPGSPPSSQRGDAYEDQAAQEPLDASAGVRTTDRIMIPEELLRADSRAIGTPATQRLHAVDALSAPEAPRATPVERAQPPIPAEPRSQPPSSDLPSSDLPSSEPASPATPSSEPPSNPSTIEPPLHQLQPPSPQEEASDAEEMEALPTLEFEAVSSEQDEAPDASGGPAMAPLGAVISGVSFTGEHAAIKKPEASPAVQVSLPVQLAEDSPAEDAQQAELAGLDHTSAPELVPGQAPPSYVDQSEAVELGARRSQSTEEVVAIDVALFMEKLRDRRRETCFAVAAEAIPHGPLIKALMAEFPGRLYEDRYNYPAEKLPPVEQHGPVLKALIHIGAPILPHLGAALDSTSLDMRFYATFLLTQLPAGPHLGRLVERLFDRDAQTREVARAALARNLHHPQLEHDALAPLRAQLDATTEELTTEILADTLGRLRDRESIPRLIRLFHQRRPRTSQVIHRALQRIALQPLPATQAAWQAWWSSAQNEPRQEWILRALNSPTDPIREMVAEELRLFEGLELRYDPQHPPQLRQHAQHELKRFFERRGR